MSEDAASRIVATIAAAERSVRQDIEHYVEACIPDAGAVVGRCPVFKANKPIAAYATVRGVASELAAGGSEAPATETSWRELVVTENFTAKLRVTLKETDPLKPWKSGCKIVCEWVSPLTSIVSVVPHAGGADAQPGAAEFCVLFLCDKKSKPDKYAVNYRDDALRYVAPDNHARLSPVAPTPAQRAAEEQHLEHLHSLAFPALRCRAYVVPAGLGGAAARDEWVQKYRSAVFNSWQRRVAGCGRAPLSCIRFAEVAARAGAVDAAPLVAVLAFEDKSVAVVPAIASGALRCSSRSLADALTAPATGALHFSAPIAARRDDESAPFRVVLECEAGRAATSLTFFTISHADALCRCVAPDEGMVTSASI
jgi:hypothetical protein